MSGKDARMDSLLDELGPLVDGDPAALARHADLLAEDDAARDVRHEAAATAAAIADAAADAPSGDDLEARVLAAIDARPSAPLLGTDASRAAAPQAPVVTTEASAAARGADPSTGVPRAVRTGAPATPPAALATGKDTSGTARIAWAIAGLGLAATVALAFGLSTSGMLDLGGAGAGTVEHSVEPTAATTARVTQIAGAAGDSTGLEIRSASGVWAPASEQALVEAGGAVRTDARTRVKLVLSDGTEIVMNHGSELRFDGAHPRHFELPTGGLVADVTHVEGGEKFTIVAPAGRIEVLGTKFVLSATHDALSVRVARGAVRLHGTTAASVEVKPGEEGIAHVGRAPTVSPVMDLARAIAWSELASEQLSHEDEAALAGLGSLRARRPGEQRDRERPLTLARHEVRVRIAGNVARTEIEEVFRNDSDTQLEGIYRFPLPSDAQIARLALDVDGTLQEGSFVARERAARIWRGVIRHATPVSQRRPTEEFIWVPGPWRDPALLEWQRGGQFELRIFPIPAHGERRVVLAYTQVVAPTAEGRRYVYPLAHATDESTRVGEMRFDVRITGAETAAAEGYALEASPDAGATRMSLEQSNFRPNGDLVIDYAMPDATRELSYWSYRGAAAAAPPEGSRDRDVEVVEAQRAIAADDRPYVALALRPRLPARTLGEARDYVIVVDASQSMIGERFARAARLVTGVVAELDRRDRFAVLVCDDTCRSMEGDARAAQLRTPSPDEARALGVWLGGISPAGPSDLVATLRAASLASGAPDPSRRRAVIYVGDGVASVGHRETAILAREAARLAEQADVSITTVGIGADSDAVALAAIARAGGGHHVPFVPGQETALAALAVLETTYGVSLRDASITLPEGLVDAAPTEVPTLRAGEELLVVARLDAPAVSGDVVLRGKVGGEAFEQRYAVQIEPSTSSGNLFVPSLWASRTIAELELSGRGEDEARIVALSKAYSVMSRHTSLLVLESDAMFRAFGVDRVDAEAQAPQWTGEDAAEGESAGELLADADEGTLSASLDAVGGAGRIGAGFGGGGLAASGDAFASGAARSRSAAAPMARAESSAPSTAAPSVAAAPAFEAAQDRALRDDVMPTVPQRPLARARMMPPPPPPPRGRWMRRVWYRVGEIQTNGAPSAREEEAARRAEEALRLAPDSRDRHRDAVRALARAGQIGRALEVAEAWFSRDRQDPESLVARADLLARLGRRDDAVRVMRGAVDIRPDDAALHERLAAAFDRAGDAARACAHRVSLAEIRRDDPEVVGRAVRCERLAGERMLADATLDAVRDVAVRRRAEAAAMRAEGPSSPRGELMIDATWSGSDDVDLALIAPDGTRLSWMGGRSTVVGRDAMARGHEQLGLRGARVGQYVVEVARTSLDDARAVHGQLRIRVLDETRTVPFSIGRGKSSGVARIVVRQESRLEATGAW